LSVEDDITLSKRGRSGNKTRALFLFGGKERMGRLNNPYEEEKKIITRRIQHAGWGVGVVVWGGGKSFVVK